MHSNLLDLKDNSRKIRMKPDPRKRHLLKLKPHQKNPKPTIADRVKKKLDEPPSKKKQHSLPSYNNSIRFKKI
ncbi:conserved hypothetical protein [Ricinus communis]|uniref:Uncharacterized protein n=1 Tax=Ricinus communis TaxID=3988 RepID=B9SVE8_RICCO|nr:conserved hypothetical protein [Ricinus communis]